MTVCNVRGDASRLPLPDASVDLIVTSPPYWSLRSYQDGGQHYSGQIGAESTPAAYIDNLISCTREWMRVLKPSGSLWVNLGDKYAQSDERSRNGVGGAIVAPLRTDPVYGCAKNNGDVRVKSLMGLPWRYALGCIDELGLILRAEVIWSKPNGLPESVKDRVRRAHEIWFHFTKAPTYYANVDAIREPYQAPTATRSNPGDNPNRRDGGGNARNAVDSMNPLGKLPGSVWTIASQPLKVPAELGIDHFAAFPMEFPRRIILGWSPPGICTRCGEGRRTATARSTRDAGGAQGRATLGHVSATGQADGRQGARRASVITVTGEVCACDDATAPARHAVVLDPFGGTGTTALVASVLGRVGVSVDMSADYCRLAQWRISDTKQLARAQRQPQSKMGVGCADRH